jgi:hypothetical protein
MRLAVDNVKSRRRRCCRLITISEDIEMTEIRVLKSVIVLLIAVLQLTGCTSIDNVRPGSGEGTKFTVYRRSYDEIWNAAVSVAGQRLTLVESDKHTGMIKAEAMDSTFGEALGIFISPPRTGEKKYLVEVLSLLKNRPQIPGKDAEPQVIGEIKTKLDI